MGVHIWMEHAEHGGRALLPDLPYWRAQGWEPCDGPPPEPDLTRDPLPDPEPEETTDAPGPRGRRAVRNKPAAEPAQSEEG